MNKPTGDDWFNAARWAATTLAVVGVGGAAAVAYRRQDINEQAHKLEAERHEADRERELRSRFTTIAEQLSGKASVRLAGAYALAALADDWYRFERKDERQVCVSLLCAQLRSPRRAKPNEEEDEFRETVVSIISQHRPSDAENSWSSCGLDLRGSDLSGLNLSDANLSGCRTNLTGANLTGANLTAADFTCANLSGEARFDGADLNGTVLNRANLAHAHLAAHLNNVKLNYADLTCADLARATFGGKTESDQTKWPEGFQLTNQSQSGE
ncbi:pentapeptide repeat-containing protein [Mycobacterium marinum]|uniref:pentapeptide repeat-containing protein n=1 Tax=Mycobacterium marinum TaxID=1781 RepID=UPI00235823F6|nr:pentapeptide repeat-containing protein [Mycobacterium marinum]MDC9015129.1 pentapeptide repeat-containing protein [Mycobacterium marinum]